MTADRAGKQKIRKSTVASKLMLNAQRLTHNEKGFTLVELAIVLVIIGIILGAVLKGQELINNAKIKRAYSQQKEMLAAIYTYYDKYGKYPGDDPNAAARWAGTTSGNNDGLINGFTFNCAAGATTETCQVWRHLRNANIIIGDSSSAQNPNNAFGGSIGVGYVAVSGTTTQWIGLDNVPYDAACSLDTQYDDGVYNTGSIRTTAGTNYCAATTGIYDLYFKL